MIVRGRELIAVAAALGLYRRSIVPQVRRELLVWEARAEAIPDSSLRHSALLALREKGLNAEATAVFATLAPRKYRVAATRSMTAFQVAVDFLDLLGEQPALDPLANGLQLHKALRDALSPNQPVTDWYALHERSEDGGYLHTLVTACREAVAALPSSVASLPLARRAAARCGEGQSYTHATKSGGSDRLREWASRQRDAGGYLWWEIAAGASSSVAAHAQIAAAADPRTTLEESALIDAAYFPPIGALTVMLDDLIDLDDDRGAGEHNYMTYYASSTVAARRLALLTDYGRTATQTLRHSHRHTAILLGVAGFYLSAPGATSNYAAPIRARMLKYLGFAVRPILVLMRFSRPD